MAQTVRNGHAASTRARPNVRLSLLGGFELSCDGKQVELPLSSQRVLAFLALHDHALTRIYVAGNLWLDTSEQRSRANLRSALWRLRRPGATFVEATSTHLRLGREVVVDVTELVETLRRLLSVNADGAEELDRRSLDGDLLTDWYDDWLLHERERFRELRLHALQAHAERLAAAGRYGEAIEAALAAVAAEPLRESAERALICIHLAEGNRDEALRRYRAYCKRLRDSTGLQPSPQLDALVADLGVARRR